MGGTREQTQAGATTTPTPLLTGRQQSADDPLQAPSLRMRLSDLQRMQLDRDAPVDAWLTANESQLPGSSMSALVTRIRTEIGPQPSPLTEAELEAVIRRYAGVHDIHVGGLVATTPAGGGGGINFGAAAQSLSSGLSAIPTEIRVEDDHGWALIEFGGATVGLRSGRSRIGGTVGWNGTFNLDSRLEGIPIGGETGSLRFRGSLNRDRWSMRLGFRIGPNMPDLSRLGSIFTAGQEALGNIAAQTANLSDPIAAGTEIAGQVGPLRRAVSAAEQIGRTRPGPSLTIDPELFGRLPGGPVDQPPIGFGISARFTYVF
jgi:hypothetical protein